MLRVVTHCLRLHVRMPASLQDLRLRMFGQDTLTFLPILCFQDCRPNVLSSIQFLSIETGHILPFCAMYSLLSYIVP
jgi:hypothetical protein